MFEIAVNDCVLPGKIKLPQIINIYWPLFETKLPEPSIIDIEEKIIKFHQMGNLFEAEKNEKELTKTYDNTIIEMFNNLNSA